LKLKFQTVGEKPAKNFRGLLYFAAPGSSVITYRKRHWRAAVTTLRYRGAFIAL